MSPVALILNLALGALLVGAIILGQRLDKRLRALRESHNSFAKAVSELDQAAHRTQMGLNDLKAAAEDSRNALAERIDAARLLSERLGKLIGEADVKTQALTRVHEQIKAPRPILLRTGADAAPAATRPDARLPLRPAARAEAAPLELRTPAPRSRAAVDDDLFEAGAKPPLSAFAGGRR